MSYPENLDSVNNVCDLIENCLLSPNLLPTALKSKILELTEFHLNLSNNLHTGPPRKLDIAIITNYYERLGHGAHEQYHSHRNHAGSMMFETSSEVPSEVVMNEVTIGGTVVKFGRLKDSLHFQGDILKMFRAVWNYLFENFKACDFGLCLDSKNLFPALLEHLPVKTLRLEGEWRDMNVLGKLKATKTLKLSCETFSNVSKLPFIDTIVICAHFKTVHFDGPPNCRELIFEGEELGKANRLLVEWQNGKEENDKFELMTWKIEQLELTGLQKAELLNGLEVEQWDPSTRNGVFYNNEPLVCIDFRQAWDLRRKSDGALASLQLGRKGLRFAVWKGREFSQPSPHAIVAMTIEQHVKKDEVEKNLSAILKRKEEIKNKIQETEERLEQLDTMRFDAEESEMRKKMEMLNEYIEMAEARGRN